MLVRYSDKDDYDRERDKIEKRNSGVTKAVSRRYKGNRRHRSKDRFREESEEHSNSTKVSRRRNSAHFQYFYT